MSVTTAWRQYLLNNYNTQLQNQETVRRRYEKQQIDPNSATGTDDSNIQLTSNAETDMRSDFFTLMQPYIRNADQLQKISDGISDDDADLLVLNFNSSVKPVLDSFSGQKGWNIDKFRQRLVAIANELRTKQQLGNKIDNLTTALTQRNAADHAKDTEIKMLKNRISTEKSIPEKYRQMFDVPPESVTPDLAPRKLDPEMEKVDPEEIKHKQREIKQLYQETKDLKFQKEIWLSATKSLRQVDRKIKSTKNFSETVLNNKLKEIGDDPGLLELYLVNLNKKIAERPERKPAYEGEHHAEGLGLQHQITGGGKYFVDRHRLGNNNMLTIRYTNNRHHIPIKQQYVSSQLRNLIEHALDNNGDVDRKLFHKLSDVEQNLFRALMKYIDVDEVGSGLDDNRSWVDKFDVLRGEIQSGNSSAIVKHQMREMLRHGLMIGRFSRRDYSDFIDRLHL